MGSPPVKRIEDVRALRAAQFPEDAGPLAHPVRPDSYIEISNFYTATIYTKGAEVIRMMHTLLGPEKFRAGADLYFERHDGQAVTCEDFVRAMEDASGVDLDAFPHSGTARRARRGSRRSMTREGGNGADPARADDAADAGPAGQGAGADPAQARFVRRRDRRQAWTTGWCCSTRRRRSW